MSYKLFLDDRREPKEPGWVVVRNQTDFIRTIVMDGLPSCISFDYDLLPEHYELFHQGKLAMHQTGYNCALWLIEYCYKHHHALPEYLIHSANPHGAAALHTLLTKVKSFLLQRSQKKS